MLLAAPRNRRCSYQQLISCNVGSKPGNLPVHVPEEVWNPPRVFKPPIRPGPITGFGVWVMNEPGIATGFFGVVNHLHNPARVFAAKNGGFLVKDIHLLRSFYPLW